MKNKLKLKAATRQQSNFRAEGSELMLYGVVGSFFDDLEGKKVVDSLRSMSGDITIRVNSPGGDVFDGMAIANVIKEREGRTTVVVDGLCASIASVIAMAADEIVMSEGSFMMVHNPWTMAMGDADEMRHTAGVLDKIGGTMAEIYSKRTGKTVEEARLIMNAETWMTADEAVEAGFADVVSGLENEEAQVAALFDLSVFNNVPEPLKVAAKARKPQTVRELEQALRTLGYSRTEAKAVASGGLDALDRREAGPEDCSEKLLVALENRKKALQGA